MDNLNSKTGKDFNNAYMDMMLDDHKNTIGLFKTEAGRGTSAVLKDFATPTLPNLQKQLEAVQAITRKR